jgi:putative endonuclease
VAEWYRARGYEILARNWRCRQGELDLVVRGNGALVFCEVKTRTSDAFGLPAEAVTRQKQARVRRLAAIWLSEQGPTDAAPPRASRGRRASARPEIRFDVGVVLAGAVDVLEGAF